MDLLPQAEKGAGYDNTVTNGIVALLCEAQGIRMRR